MDKQEQAKRVQNVLAGRPATMSQFDKVELIIDWFDERSDISFDMKFVHSMEKNLERGVLTDNQEAALDNIINSWHIKSK